MNQQEINEWISRIVVIFGTIILLTTIVNGQTIYGSIEQEIEVNEIQEDEPSSLSSSKKNEEVEYSIIPVNETELKQEDEDFSDLTEEEPITIKDKFDWKPIIIGLSVFFIFLVIILVKLKINN